MKKIILLLIVILHLPFVLFSRELTLMHDKGGTPNYQTYFEEISKLTEKEINKNLKLINGWFLKDDYLSISKTFIFKDFREAFSWMTNVSVEAETLNHHPEWSNVYNKVDVNLSTHDVSGLSKKDFLIAIYMDQEFIGGK